MWERRLSRILLLTTDKYDRYGHSETEVPFEGRNDFEYASVVQLSFRAIHLSRTYCWLGYWHRRWLDARRVYFLMLWNRRRAVMSHPYLKLGTNSLSSNLSSLQVYWPHARSYFSCYWGVPPRADDIPTSLLPSAISILCEVYQIFYIRIRNRGENGICIDTSSDF
jgi:hypothetical protein